MSKGRKLSKMEKRTKILMYCDAPTSATGFSTVSRNIAEALYKTGKYDIDIFGINFWGDPYSQKEMPYRIWPAGTNAQRDPYGRQKFAQMALQMDFDILFLLQDTFILNFVPPLIDKLKEQGKKFKSVCFSGDTDILTRGGIKNIKDVNVGDLALSYDTESGETVFKSVTKVYAVPFNGSMVNIKGQSTDLSVTPDHRMYMVRNNTADWTNAGKMYERANTVSEYFPNFKGVSNNKKLNSDVFNLYKCIDKKSIVVVKPINGCIDFRKKLSETFLLSGENKILKSKKKVSIEYDKHVKGYKIPLERFIDNNVDLEKFKDNYNCIVYIKSRKSDRSSLPISMSMSDFIKLSAWYITEGCCTYYTNDGDGKIYNELSIASNVMEGREINYRQHIKAILDSTGVCYREKTKDFLLKGTTLVGMFKDYFGNGAVNKQFPDWFFDLDIKYLRLLFDELLNGDGSKDKKNYTTKSKLLAEQITLLAFMLGIRAHYNYSEDRDIYTVSFTYNDSQNFLTGVRKDNFSKENFNGTVYCVEVEDTHTVFAGRNNYFSITGQCYYPIDGRPKPEWINNVNPVDYLVTYTEYAKRMSEEVFPAVQDAKIIYHGANVKDYFPIDKAQVQQFKERYLGPKHKDKFIITNISRNQQRKDIPRTIAAFKEFKKQVPESLLYLHMAKKDQGWDLEAVVRAFGLTLDEDVKFPENFNVNQGYPREFVNMIYNMTDLLVSTTTGEGFGLSWIEAMATKTPVLMPDNTAMTELITEDKGYLSKSMSDSSQFIIMPNDNDVIRPLVDVDDMVTQMLIIYNDYDAAIKKTGTAYDWVHTKMDWQGTVGRQWVSLFNEARQALSAPEVEVISGGDGNVIEAESF